MTTNLTPWDNVSQFVDPQTGALSNRGQVWMQTLLLQHKPLLTPPRRQRRVRRRRQTPPSLPRLKPHLRIAGRSGARSRALTRGRQRRFPYLPTLAFMVTELRSRLVLAGLAAWTLRPEAFFTEAGWQDVAEYRSADCLKSLQFLATNETGILLVAQEDGEIVGMAGGLVSPLYFNLSHMTGQELFWWVKPGARGSVGVRLIDALEKAAKDKGCTSWAMGIVSGLNADRTEKLLDRRGYRPSERTYIKRLAA